MAIANKFWRAPTVAGHTAEGVTNFITNIPGPLTMNQQTYRGDQILGKYGSAIWPLHSRQIREQQYSYNSTSIDYGIEQYFQTEDSWMFGHTISIGART